MATASTSLRPMRRLSLLVLWLSSVAGCVALVGVDLDPSLQLPGSVGEGGSSGDPNVTADGCVRSNCDSLGVACGNPEDGCGGTLSCTDCANGCTPSNAAVACTGRCNAVADGCGGFHDCGAAACGDAGAICFETRCCEPTFECGDACGVSVPRGCGLGSLECPGPGVSDTYVCFEGKRCTPRACDGQCDVDILDGCGGTLHCPAPALPQVCYQGQVCYPQGCGPRCDGEVDPGCGLEPERCWRNLCPGNQCCTYIPEFQHSECMPNDNPGTACMIQ